jgi:predicted metalloendopeptidase
VANLDEFHDAFGLVQNDKQYMAQSERVRIW